MDAERSVAYDDKSLELLGSLSVNHLRKYVKELMLFATPLYATSLLSDAYARIDAANPDHAQLKQARRDIAYAERILLHGAPLNVSRTTLVTMIAYGRTDQKFLGLAHELMNDRPKDDGSDVVEMGGFDLNA